MQNDVMAKSMSSDGFLLLDSSMNPIFVNPVATQILVYPEKPEARKNLSSYVADRVSSTLFSQGASTGPALVSRFLSGRRTYRCRCFQANSKPNGHIRASLAVLLERGPARSDSLAYLSEKFHLTTREQEVSQFLLQGLTSKQIAIRMEISPNTVKAFLRLIMAKTGASSRSGIVIKAFTLGS